MSAAKGGPSLDEAIAAHFDQPPTLPAAANDNDGGITSRENTPAAPLVRKGQTWLFKGQNWKIHDVLADGVIVLIGPHNRHELLGTFADELYQCGELRKEAPSVDKATEKLARAFEKAQEQLLKPKRPKRGPKPKPPPVRRPWKCSVLAVDTAANSGWSCWMNGGLRDFGEVKTSKDSELRAICQMVHEYPPAVLVLEAPAGMVYAGRGAAVLVGLGAAREAWRRAWRDAGGLKSRIVSVHPTRWRSALFGRVRNVKDLELQQARMILEQHGAKAPDNLRPDEAAALDIGSWAAFAGEVGAALPALLRIEVV